MSFERRVTRHERRIFADRNPHAFLRASPESSVLLPRLASRDAEAGEDRIGGRRKQEWGLNTGIYEGIFRQ